MNVDVGTGRGGIDYVLGRTLSHEITHSIQRWNPQGYEALKDFIIEKMGDSFEGMVSRKMKRLGLKYAEAVDEVIADSCEMMLRDTKALSEFAKEHRTVFEKICDVIEEFINNIRKAISSLYGESTALHDEAKFMELYADELQAVFDKVLSETLEISESTVDHSLQSNTNKKTAEDGGKVQYSIVNLDSGKSYVEASRRIITGNDVSQWRKQISEFFKKSLKNGDLSVTTVEGDILTITKETAKKARSKTITEKGVVRELTDEEFRVKLTAESHIDELSKISKSIKGKDGTPKVINDTKNHSFAKDGFTYRTVYFKDFNGAYYRVTLSVGKNNGISTVYNVGKLKTDSIPDGNIVSTIGSKADMLSADTIILNSSEKSNSKEQKSASLKKDEQHSRSEAYEAAENGEADSEGNTLSKGQQKYFKDSLVRDEDGNLLVVYHGSEKGGFTVFDSKFSDDKLSLFFTRSRAMAKSYSGTYDAMDIPGAKKGLAKAFEGNTKKSRGKAGIYKVYLNLTNPLIIDAKGSGWNGIADKGADAAQLCNMTITPVYGAEDVIDSSSPVEISIETDGGESFYKRFKNHHEMSRWLTKKYGGHTGTKVHQFAINAEKHNTGQLTYSMWLNSEGMAAEDGDILTTRELAERAKARGHDGVIIKNLFDYGDPNKTENPFPNSNDVYIVFDSNQAKDVGNTNPTEHKDIRYSRGEGYTANKKTAEDGGKAQYSRGKISYDEWDVQTALYDALDHADKGYDHLIKVGTMPKYITDKLGIDGDFYIYRNHIYENIVSKEQAIKDERYVEGRHYHDLGFEITEAAIMALENPILSIATKTSKNNPAVAMILPVKGKNGIPLYSVMSLYSQMSVNGDYSKKPHVVLSIYEMDMVKKTDGETKKSRNKSLEEIVEQAIKDGKVFDFDKKMRDALSVIAERTRLGNITETSLKESLTQFSKEIKTFKEKNKIQYSRGEGYDPYEENTYPSYAMMPEFGDPLNVEYSYQGEGYTSENGLKLFSRYSVDTARDYIMSELMLSEGKLELARDLNEFYTFMATAERKKLVLIF